MRRSNSPQKRRQSRRCRRSGMEDGAITGGRLTAWAVAVGGRRVRLGFVDENGCACAISLPIDLLSVVAGGDDPPHAAAGSWRHSFPTGHCAWSMKSAHSRSSAPTPKLPARRASPPDRERRAAMLCDRRTAGALASHRLPLAKSEAFDDAAEHLKTRMGELSQRSSERLSEWHSSAGTQRHVTGP